ncbi:MAG: imidazole glycerol phosphate synthase subunit HisF [Candidatus Marinimicrobia bacterium]|nr:imidazole glycerol phosphate synthase subunit HisF [Candidatus Neomarinimicrobiota bacterium]
MSSALRIIPRIDIKGPNVVKGMHLEGLRVLGKPEKFASYYYEQGADEIFYQDIVASLYGRNSLHELISKTAKEVFIPLTIGGGLRSLDDISSVLRAGADKVSINTAAHENPNLIVEASKVFGKSTIVVAIEAIKQSQGTYEAFTDNGRNRTGREVVLWAREVEKLGAGEIILTSVDQEGTGKGLDIELIRNVFSAINIPLVVHGGIGKIEHVIELLNELKVSGIAMASLVHYHYYKKIRNTFVFEDEGNIEFLKSNRTYSNISPIDLKTIKSTLNNNSFLCRPI